MSQLRADLWCAAFVRRHNDLGQLCVVSRKGHPIAGQVWIEIDHLNGTQTLFAPAPALANLDDSADRIFECRLERVAPDEVRARVQREADFDPDFWLLSLETRRDDHGLIVV